MIHAREMRELSRKVQLERAKEDMPIVAGLIRQAAEKGHNGATHLTDRITAAGLLDLLKRQGFAVRIEQGVNQTFLVRIRWAEDVWVNTQVEEAD